jgi:peptidoglycan/xylan/chitin deacetylase (PgdA/CDA1 family)
MDVASHTCTHRVVQTLGDAALLRELEESKQRLEAELDRPVRALAYPVGQAARYEPRIRDAVRATGYELAFSNRAGVNFAACRPAREC